MVGTPIRNARRTGLRMIKLRIPAEEWRQLSEVDRIKAMFGMNLDDVHTLCSIPWQEADMHERSLKIQVFVCLMKTGLALFERREREEFRQKVLENLGVMIDEHKKAM